MGFSRNEHFDGTPDNLYLAVKTLAQQYSEIAGYIVWNDPQRCGEINYLGAKARFSVDESSRIVAEVNIGFPASWEIKEGDVQKRVDELFAKLREQFPEKSTGVNS